MADPSRATAPEDQVPDPVTGSVVLGLAVGVFGVSFGVLAAAAGLSPAKACAMSLLVFTGASQFAAVGVIDAGGSTAAALGMGIRALGAVVAILILPLSPAAVVVFHYALRLRAERVP